MVRERGLIGDEPVGEVESGPVSAEVVWEADAEPTLVPDPLDDPERPIPPADPYWREHRVKRISGL
jgi:hypothetical protein